MTSNQVVTRFAPSPTGFLHVGGARTALFNWLFSKSVGGRFLLRIEDTDKERSTKQAIDAILSGMEWLGLFWDGEHVMQSTRAERHREVVEMMLSIGKAYRCYMSPQEIEEAKIRNPSIRFRSVWRDKDNSVSSGQYTVRLKALLSGSTEVEDAVHGRVSMPNDSLDDVVLLRSDGTPTYMLAVVVDDYDSGVNHIIRGDDHFTNTFRQLQIYDALGWERPSYAHIPLIHGSDGTKLSKRHGALGIDVYREMGYLPEAMCNYLLRLGWSKGDIELITKEDVSEIFQLSDITQSPARFDLEKLNYVNAHYIKHKEDFELLDLLKERLEKIGILLENSSVSDKILSGMQLIKTRANTLKQLTDLVCLYIEKKSPTDPKSQELIDAYRGSELIQKLIAEYKECKQWDAGNLKSIGVNIAVVLSIKPALVMQVLRAFIIATFESPGIYEFMEVLGKEEVLRRINELK